MTARKKIEKLLDSKSFAEINCSNDCGIICGYGTIAGRTVCIYSHDSDINGVLTKNNLDKIDKIFDMAVKTGVPIISVWETMKIKLDEGIEVLKKLNNILKKHVEFSGVIPQIAIVSGRCVGTLSTFAFLNDFIFSIDRKGKIVPNLLNDEASSKDEISHFILKNEEELFTKVRELFSFIPDNNLTDPGIEEPKELNRLCCEVTNIINNDNYDVKELLRKITDNNLFFEIYEHLPNDVVTGFIRLGGRSVGVIANQSINNSVVLNSKDFDKMSRFIRFCDSFNIPLITFIDSCNLSNETFVMKDASKMFYAYAEATIPKISIILKNAFGASYLLMGGLDSDISYALENSKISVANPAVMAIVLSNDEIKDKQSRIDKINEYENNEMFPINALKQNVINDIIKPEEIRQKLISALYFFISKRENRPVKKHGNIPL